MEQGLNLYQLNQNFIKDLKLAVFHYGIYVSWAKNNVNLSEYPNILILTLILTTNTNPNPNKNGTVVYSKT